MTIAVDLGRKATKQTNKQKGVELRHFFPSEMLRGRLVCGILTPTVSILLYSNLHNDCSLIEDVYLLFYAHFMNIFSFLRGLELRHFIVRNA